MDDRYGLIASLRGLLGKVTPNLRAVTIKVNHDDKLVTIYFFYDGEVLDKDIATANSALSEIMYSFSPDYKLDGHIERLDYPTNIPEKGRLVFMRREF